MAISAGKLQWVQDALDAGVHQNPDLQAGQSMPEKTRQELLQPFPAVVAQRLLARKTGRPFYMMYESETGDRLGHHGCGRDQKVGEHHDPRHTGHKDRVAGAVGGPNSS